MDFDLLIDAVANGEVDIAIAAITITNEREEKVAFSNPYLNAGQVIITNESDQEISIPEDLEDKKVGVQNGTTSEEEALKYTNETNVIKYNDYIEAVTNLEAGTIDAIIIDRPAGIGLTKDNSNIKIVGNPFTNELYGIAIKKGESALKTEINKVIASGIIDTFETKWF
jgi:polar amino acid transport system substrate-binding protein